jgi:hypothetical protein
MSTTTIPPTTAAALETLADRVELTELVSRLGRWLDDPDSADPRSLLAEDVTVRSPGGEARGRDRVVAQAKRTHDAVVTQHAMTDVLADVDADEATITSNLLVAFLGHDAEPAPTWVSGSRYRFGARRTAGGWRLTRIEVAPVWQVGERPIPARPKTA